MKRLLFVILVLFTKASLAVEIDSTEKDIDGRVVFLNFDDAKSYCAGLGKRLPTAREFAEFSMSLGAAGIRETQYPGISLQHPKVQAEINGNNYREQYWPIDKPDNNGIAVIDFYYRNHGYNFPDPEEWMNLWFWTSSISPDPYGRTFPWITVWAWQSSVGNFISADCTENEKRAIRCARD